MDLLPSDRLSFSLVTLLLFIVGESLILFLLFLVLAREFGAFLSALFRLYSFFDRSEDVLVDAALH